MSNETKNKFCPECGTPMEGKTLCQKCGFDLNATPPKPATTVITSESKQPIPRTKDDSTWNSLEEIVSIGGWLSWFFLMIAALVLIFQVITYFIGGEIFWGIWYIASTLFIIYTIFTYGKIYSSKCKAKDWKFLMTDIVIIGKFRIPKMLAYGVLLFIFSQGWGGFLVYVSAFLIYFLSPEKGTHKWQVE